LRGERELAAHEDHGPHADLVGERGHEPAVHDPRRTLVVVGGDEAGDDVVAVALEREAEAERGIRAAAEARLAAAELAAVDQGFTNLSTKRSVLPRMSVNTPAVLGSAGFFKKSPCPASLNPTLVMSAMTALSSMRCSVLVSVVPVPGRPA